MRPSVSIIINHLFIDYCHAFIHSISTFPSEYLCYHITDTICYIPHLRESFSSFKNFNSQFLLSIVHLF